MKIKRTYLYAAALLLLMALYFVSGWIFATDPDTVTEVEQERERPVMTVRVRHLTGEEIPREVVLAGRTAPGRRIIVRAETPGIVAAVSAARGSQVAESDLLVKIAEEDRPERLQSAQAILDQRRLEYNAARRLRDQDLQAENLLALALAQLRTAEQQVRNLELDLKRTSVRAAFGGIWLERHVEQGDYVGVGDPIGILLDTDPIIVVGHATEWQLPYLAVGEHGEARLSDGRRVEGYLRYVASESDDRTRTYRIELAIPNPAGAIAAGMTAELVVETERVVAHRVSPALISINDDGSFGVKHVDADDTVRFVSADIVKSSPDALWLGSLPEQIRLITVGQGFTREGDKVKVVLE
ncbi:MAG: efflux RND transporter periplasmic adaptor subunit [Verrucomicrobia bacterium]|nr:efflux RND transporter periplasmic adaptor subunit [Verrucomicrobiota bacterium]